MTDKPIDTLVSEIRAAAELAIHGDPTDVEPWVCIGCGAGSPRKIKPCNCPSGLVMIKNDLRRHAEWRVEVGPHVPVHVPAANVPTLTTEIERLTGKLVESEAREGALRAQLNPGPHVVKDIHIHDDDWEATYQAADVFEMIEDLDPGQVVEISRLLRIPPVWAAIVAADNGETGITLHSSRGEAERALLPTDIKEPSDDR